MTYTYFVLWLDFYWHKNYVFTTTKQHIQVNSIRGALCMCVFLFFWGNFMFDMEVSFNFLITILIMKFNLIFFGWHKLLSILCNRKWSQRNRQKCKIWINDLLKNWRVKFMHSTSLGIKRTFTRIFPRGKVHFLHFCPSFFATCQFCFQFFDVKKN